MAKLEATLHGDFQAIISDLENEIMQGSASASKEDSVLYEKNGVRCYTGVFERYSYTGGNRVSMTVTLFGDEAAGGCSLNGTPSARNRFWRPLKPV